MKKLFVSLFLLLAVLTYPLTALAAEAKVALMVEGLSCPFCVYGLEKRIKKVEGVTGVTIDLEGGRVEIIFKDREDVRIEKIEEAVRDAGFTPGSIDVRETGKR